MVDEPGITTLSSKGQVVIPQKLREHLGMAAHTKFLVYGQGDTIVLRRLELPNAKKEWQSIFASIDKKRVPANQAQVDREVQAVRKRRRKPTG